MIVELIASTVITGWSRMRDAGWVDHDDAHYDDPDERFRDWNADYLAEFAGRLCYQSWARPNPDTATNEGYLANIIAQQHFSVLEHSSATFYVAGVSRSLSHELVRHRHLSFSQLSQRFVDESNIVDTGRGAVVPPALIADFLQDAYVAATLKTSMLMTHEAYAFLVQHLMENRGLTRKQAREAARCVLPNMTETRFVVTGNLRAWRDVITKRISPAADAEMQRFVQAVLAELKEIARNTFQDM